MAEGMVERVGERLRKECLDVFGSTWNYDVAWRFARAAIEAMREPNESMIMSQGKSKPENAPTEAFRASAERLNRSVRSQAKVIYQEMIDAALKQEEEKA